MTWILFVLVVGTGPAMATAEFATQDQCEQAGSAVQKKFAQPLRRIDYFCYERR